MHLTYRWERPNGDEVEIEVDFTVSTYYPAVLGRSPELCRDAEGGEIERLFFSCSDPVAYREFCAEYKRSGHLQDEIDAACEEAAADYRGSWIYQRSLN